MNYKKSKGGILVEDGLMNVVSGLGTNKSKREHNQWVYGQLNDYASLDACFSTNWIARQIVEVPAQDMTREWRRIKSGEAEAIAELEQELCLAAVVEEAAAWARLFGGAGVLMLTGQDLTKPLNVNKIKKGDLKSLITFDRHELAGSTMNTYDVLAANYLQPDFYTVQGGNQQIHWSHFARFTGERLPRRQLAQTQGWGDSVLRKCIEDISDMVAAKGGIAELLQEANIDVITREGLSEELASDQDDAITQRYELFSQMKSIINMALLDGDETYDRKTLNLSGVAPILDIFITWISGAARIPVTKLFGSSAKGMNATGEGDLKNYNDDIRAQQNSALMRPMRTIDEVLVRSATGQWQSDYDYEWNPLDQPNTVEVAQSELLRAQKNVIYLESGVATKSQIQRELQAGEEYQFNDEVIEELEELESANMFEELSPIGQEQDELDADTNQ